MNKEMTEEQLKEHEEYNDKYCVANFLPTVFNDIEPGLADKVLGEDYMEKLREEQRNKLQESLLRNHREQS